MTLPASPCPALSTATAAPLPARAFVGGRVLPLTEAVVPLEDRGFLFGEAAYEVLLTAGEAAFAEREHAARLERSLVGIGLDGSTAAALLAEVRAKLLREIPRAQWGVLYVQITGGVGPREHVPQQAPPLGVYGFWRPMSQDALRSARDRGVSLGVVRDQRWDHATFKTTQLLANVMAKREALAAQQDEVLIVGRSGELLECSSANVFVVIDGVATTPPTSANILPGVTREILLRLFPEGCRAMPLPIGCLDLATEVFITSTTRPVVGVRAIGGRALGGPFPGPVTRACAAALDSLMSRAFGESL